MKVMIDLNVILDVVTNRPQWVNASAKVCTIAGSGSRVQAIISPHAITTVYYLARKHANKVTAERAVDWLMEFFGLAPCGLNEFRRARELPINDFEDAVVASGAESSNCDYIVTRTSPTSTVLLSRRFHQKTSVGFFRTPCLRVRL